MALLPPSFLSSSPATVRERADGGRQGNKRRVGAARRRSRGHGPARLDGTRPRATVADKVMKSGRRLDKATAALMCRPHASEARRPGAGSRAVGVRDGSPSGARLVQRGSMQRTTARPAPCFLAGDANEWMPVPGPEAKIASDPGCLFPRHRTFQNNNVRRLHGRRSRNDD